MNAPQILVVDDEADIRTLIDEILSDEGHQDYQRVVSRISSSGHLQFGGTPDSLLAFRAARQSASRSLVISPCRRGPERRQTCPKI